ncbi:MAG: class I SAM-dependent methyltransferase [Candidatus Thermoplasmatota archaeon]|nr:class I SAM-dependent methyltransferase [Candidatus Thermoplasmatota archaeon]
MYKDITEKLSRNFTRSEIDRSSTGGWFGVKESLLFTLVRSLRPLTIVETGVAQGVSSYVILRAIKLNGKGKLISVDLPNRVPTGYAYSDGTQDPVYVPQSLEPGWLVPSELRSSWTLLIGKSSKVLPTLNSNLDLFFHDSEHSYENMMFEFEWALLHLSKNGIISSDDISWNTSFHDFMSKHKELHPIFDKYEFGAWNKKTIKI